MRAGGNARGHHVRPAFMLGLMVLPAFTAGCFGEAEPSSLAMPDTLRAVYRAPSGEELHVETDGFGQVRNATGATVTSFRINYALDLAPNGSPLIPFTTEHIDPETGMIIRHDRHCVPRGSLSDTPCYEGRFAITYKAAGLPGGLGMAPTWFSDASYYRGGALIVDTVQAGPRAYRVDRDVDSACTVLSIRAVATAPYLRSWSSPTVLEGPWRFCPPFLVPQSFRPTHDLPDSASSAENITFDLIEYTEGAGLLQNPKPGKPSPDCRGQWIDAARQHAPLSDQDMPLFTSLEAHAKARELDARYRAMTESIPANVVGGTGAGGGGFTSNFPHVIQSSRTYSWTLTASGDEQARVVHVSKRYTDATLTSPSMTSYEIKSAEDADPAQVGVTFGDNLRLSIGSVGQLLEPFENVELLNIAMGRSTSADWLPEGAPRDQDYVASYFFRKIPDGEGQSGGPGVVVPLWISMDSTRPAVTGMTIMAEDRDLVESMDWCPS